MEDNVVYNFCAVEVFLKDISMVRGDPRCLWEWAKIAMDFAEKYV